MGGARRILRWGSAPCLPDRGSWRGGGRVPEQRGSRQTIPAASGTQGRHSVFLRTRLSNLLAFRVPGLVLTDLCQMGESGKAWETGLGPQAPPAGQTRARTSSAPETARRAQQRAVLAQELQVWALKRIPSRKAAARRPVPRKQWFPTAGMAAVSSPGRKLSSRSTQKHTGTHSLLPSFLSTSALVSVLSQFVRGGPWHPCSARRLPQQNSPGTGTRGPPMGWGRPWLP